LQIAEHQAGCPLRPLWEIRIRQNAQGIGDQATAEKWGSRPGIHALIGMDNNQTPKSRGVSAQAGKRGEERPRLEVHSPIAQSCSDQRVSPPVDNQVFRALVGRM
jgi:hypothetical protein